MSDNVKILGKLIIKGKIKLLTGLHIGGTEGNFEIGGMDNPVVRDPITKLPYIPGSSLKGKLRSELEWLLGKVPMTGNKREDGKPSNAKEIITLFGSSADQNAEGRIFGSLIVRDAFPEGYSKINFAKPLDGQELSETLKAWLELDTGLPYTEWKMENTLNRLTAKAMPRSIERVPAGSIFEYEMIYTFYSDDQSLYENFQNFQGAIGSLENGYLGGSGTRGYGKIKFTETSYVLKTPEDYKNATNGRVLQKDELGNAIQELQK